MKFSKFYCIVFSFFGSCAALLPFSDSMMTPLQNLQRIIRAAEIPLTLIQEFTYAGKEPTSKEYDYIVVGSSPAGCVITNRLTEDPDTKVLLIEAGPEESIVIDVPVINAYTVFSHHNWRFETEFQKNACSGMAGSTCPWPAGKGPGGGTLLNAMIYTRGNKRDFDSWAAEGNPGWSYDEIFPYYNKAENMMIPDLRNSMYHGQNGPLSLNYPAYETPLIKAYIQAGKYFGLNNVDYNNPNSHIGVSRIQATTVKGQRVSAGTAYLKPILKRKNFEFSLRSRVLKILIDPETKKAYGVIYEKEGKQYVVRAKREVILSAGAFNSAQLLMLSGIGPAYHLSELGIPVIQDLPVGDNLQEHPGMHGLSFLVDRNVTINPLILIRDVIVHGLDYLLKNRGKLTSLGCEGLLFTKTKYSNSSEDYPDIELLMVASSFNEDAGLLLRNSFGISNELYDQVYKEIDGQLSFSIWPMLLYPQSRGYVRLKDTNPHNHVRIKHNFLAAEIDKLILVEAIKKAIAIATSPPFKKLGARLHTRPFPQCKHLQFGSDEYWTCTIETMTTQFHHQCGTCKMGTVVDSRLRVFGVAGLRVADASIMPTITGGHTQAPCYMIGEKAADLIKEDWAALLSSIPANTLHNLT